MPNIQKITNSEIRRVSQGIVKIFKSFNSKVINSKLKGIPVFTTSYVCADKSGLFFPEVKLLEKLQKGGVLGKVSLLPLFDEEKIVAPVGGTVITIKDRDAIRTGTKVASIGK